MLYMHYDNKPAHHSIVRRKVFLFSPHIFCPFDSVARLNRRFWGRFVTPLLLYTSFLLEYFLLHRFVYFPHYALLTILSFKPSVWVTTRSICLLAVGSVCFFFFLSFNDLLLERHERIGETQNNSSLVLNVVEIHLNLMRLLIWSQNYVCMP